MNIETQVKHNGTTIALTPVLTLQTYHKPRVLLNLDFFFFYNPAIAIFVKDIVLKRIIHINQKNLIKKKNYSKNNDLI